MVFAGILFGWKYALYSMVTIFVSSRVTDAIFTKQKNARKNHDNSIDNQGDITNITACFLTNSEANDIRPSTRDT